MTDDASPKAAGGALPAAPTTRPSIFHQRSVAPLSPEEQEAKEDAMARALVFSELFGSQLVPVPLSDGITQQHFHQARMRNYMRSMILRPAEHAALMLVIEFPV